MKKFAITVLAICSLAMSVMSCGHSNNNNVPAANNNDSVSSSIGINGGSLTTPSGEVTLVVPAGALLGNTIITISRDVQLGDMGDVYDFEPSGLTFNSDVTINLKYDPALLPIGVDETDLVMVYRFGDSLMGVSSTVDTVNHFVVGQTTHFTPYEKKIGHSKPDKPIGFFNGVDVYSNGSTDYNSSHTWEFNAVNGITTGLEWECTEFVHRYYLQVYGINLSYVGNASGYYNYYHLASHDGIIAYPNDGTSLPQVGDLIISNGTPTAVISGVTTTQFANGHVAIVSGVTSTMVTIAQQNWWESSRDATGGYAPIISGNKLGIFNGGTWYPVTGWLRPAPASFSPGSLDTTFGINGKVTTAIDTAVYAHAVAIQSDAKIVVAGYSYDGSNNKFALARYNADGSLDAHFGSSGVVTTLISNWSSANALAIQSDGKIVAAGFSSTSTTKNFTLVRYKTDGSLDAGFNGNGVVITQIGTGFSIANAMAIQSDGKIIAAGFAANGNDFALARYNADGSLDTTFGVNGISTIAIESSSSIQAIAIQSDGKIVAAGSSSAGGNSHFAVARYTTNGWLDTSFGTSGKVITTNIGLGYDVANAVAIQSDSKIIVGGWSSNGTNNDFAIVRYKTDGSIDATFGVNGIADTPVGSAHDYIQGMTIQPDGKIVVVGAFISNNPFTVVRYKADGSLDLTFGNNGVVTTTIGSTDFANAVVIQPDGKIVVAGYSLFNNQYEFALTRYWP